MKIEYNLLWLDDQIDSFIEDEFVGRIESHLISEGFKPRIVLCSKSSEFFTSLNDSFDLILTDYHMSEKTGDAVVKEVRDKSIQTEILFYTAKADLTDISKINRVSFLQTEKMSGTHHENVYKAIVSLIDLTIRKFHHIVSMRGMIMHETSSLDAQNMRILNSYIQCEKNDCSLIANEVFEKIESHLSNKMEVVKKCSEANNIRKLIRDNWLFSAEYKILALSKILDKVGLDDFSEQYKDEIISIRNKFAHSVLETDKKTGRQYFKYGEDGITFDDEYCRTIRRNINKHKSNLDKLEEVLS